MSDNQYITVREASQILNVSEKSVLDLIENQKLKGYKIADKFLRLKHSEVVDLNQSKEISSENVPEPYTLSDRVKDFFYFNDFYLLAFLIICILLYLIVFR